MPTNISESLVLLGNQTGLALIPKATPLTRLNYFDGKFPRAADLKPEQAYLRHLVELSNQAGGPGVAHGFDLKLGGGDTLNVGPGLAVDPKGRVLLLTTPASVQIQQLIEKSRDQSLVSKSAAKPPSNGDGFNGCEPASAAPPTNALLPSDLYLITVAHAEGFCGEEDVYGRLCEEACSTLTDRPFVVGGLVLRALPLQLKAMPATSKSVALTQVHRRSLVASAYFADERNLVASLISGAGLKSDVWCFGAEGASGDEVPLGVIARAGQATLFLDVWTARRERIDAPAKRYWQWRMRMRPWDVVLAQILQFQCQLRDMFHTATVVPALPGPCDTAHQLVAEASDALAEVAKIYEAISGRLTELDNTKTVVPYTGGVAGLNTLQQKLQAAKEAHLLAPSNRLLINGGIVELPFAGYLPVAPVATLSVNEQVRLMLGEGVDLRFCVVRPDYVAHALEEAQHMERISLLEGLDDPQKKPEVDILVPDGEIVEEKEEARGGFEAEVDFLPVVVNGVLFEIVRRVLPGTEISRNSLDLNFTVPFTGAARSEVLPGDGRAFRAAMLFEKRLPESRSFFVAGATDTPRASAANSGEGERAAPTGPGATGVDGSAAEASSVGASSPEADAPGATGAKETGAGAPNKRLFARMAGAAVRMSRAQATMNAAGGQGEGADAGADAANANNINVEINWGKLDNSGDDSAEIVIRDREDSGGVHFKATWGKQPKEIEAFAGILHGDALASQEIKIISTKFRSNPDVLEADNERHVQALKALQVIGSAPGG